MVWGDQPFLRPIPHLFTHQNRLTLSVPREVSAFKHVVIILTSLESSRSARVRCRTRVMRKMRTKRSTRMMEILSGAS